MKRSRDARALLERCAARVRDRKGLDLLALDVRELTTVADYFLIASGRSSTQAQAIARHVEDALRSEGIRPRAVEGMTRGHWILVDYGDVVVHVFYEPIREFYDLEGMWVKAPRIELPEALEESATGTGTTGN